MEWEIPLSNFPVENPMVTGSRLNRENMDALWRSVDGATKGDITDAN